MNSLSFCLKFFSFIFKGQFSQTYYSWFIGLSSSTAWNISSHSLLACKSAEKSTRSLMLIPLYVINTFSGLTAYKILFIFHFLQFNYSMSHLQISLSISQLQIIWFLKYECSFFPQILVIFTHYTISLNMFSVSFSQTGLFFIFQILLCAIFSRLTHEQQVGTSRSFQNSISLIPVHGGEQLIFIFPLICITPHRTFLSHVGRVIYSQFDSCQMLWPAVNLQIPKLLRSPPQDTGKWGPFLHDWRQRIFLIIYGSQRAFLNV